jgi:hypothetical protein
MIIGVGAVAGEARPGHGHEGRAECDEPERAHADGLRIHGLTTAAAIWVTAALGILCGLGAFLPLALGTVFLRPPGSRSP